MCVTSRAKGIANEMEMIRRDGLGGGLGKGWKGKMVWEPLGVNRDPYLLFQC